MTAPFEPRPEARRRRRTSGRDARRGTGLCLDPAADGPGGSCTIS